MQIGTQIQKTFNRYKMGTLVSPSLLAADFTKIGSEVEMVNGSSADWLHCDIMDGIFVPNISFGFSVLKPLAKISKKPLDVHLMIRHPEPYLEKFRDAGAKWLTVHYEACNHLHRTIEEIKGLGMKAGVALNPATPVNSLDDILDYCDMVLIMTVDPGFGGQSLIISTLDKIKKLRKMIDERGCKTLIQVDGGVTKETGKMLVEAGTDVLVSGSFIFKAEDPVKNIEYLKSLTR